MATKPVTVLPAAAAAAGCTATCESYASGTSGNESFTNYSCLATPVGEWVLLRWDFVTTYTYRDGHTSTASWTRDAYNPYPPSRRDDVAVNPNDSTFTYTGTPHPDDMMSESFAATAVFRFNHSPTNLLVNSYNHESRVQLVHDPTTNLLVADY